MKLPRAGRGDWVLDDYTQAFFRALVESRSFEIDRLIAAARVSKDPDVCSVAGKIAKIDELFEAVTEKDREDGRDEDAGD